MSFKLNGTYLLFICNIPQAHKHIQIKQTDLPFKEVTERVYNLEMSRKTTRRQDWKGKIGCMYSIFRHEHLGP